MASMSLSKYLASRDIDVGIYHPGYEQTDMVNHGGDISANVAAGRLVGLINDLTMAETGVFKLSIGEAQLEKIGMTNNHKLVVPDIIIGKFKYAFSLPKIYQESDLYYQCHESLNH